MHVTNDNIVIQKNKSRNKILKIAKIKKKIYIQRKFSKFKKTKIYERDKKNKFIV